MRNRLSPSGLVLVLGLLVVSACGPATSSETGGVEPDPAHARDVALSHLRDNYDAQAPAEDLSWTEDESTREDSVGSSSFQYRTEDWLVKVTFPLASPDATIYDIRVFNRSGTFYWEGQVDAADQVTEIRINPVEEAGLAQTAELEILEFDPSSDSPTGGEYIHRLAISDPQLLTQLLVTLDTDLRVAPRLQCIPKYTLRFRAEDGSVQEFGYSCGGASFLRGEQDFWEGRDFQPAEQFDRLILGHLASILPTQVNVTEQAGLVHTSRIELFETVSSEVSGQPGVVEAQVIHHLTITDPERIAEFVSALDTDIPLGLRARVPAPYVLQFHLEDGTMHSFGYLGDAENASILRGDQGFWHGQDGTPTARFTALMQELLASSSSGNGVAVLGPVPARDAALAYLAEAYGEWAPRAGLTWKEEDIAPEGIVGSSSLQYTAGDWVVNLAFPVVAPEATLYQVVVTNETTGFHWEGEVNASGVVAELTGPEGPEVRPSVVSQADLAELVKGNSAFAFDLYRLLREEDGNLFYSPYSISLALAMTYAGAHGETEQQMADALHFLLSQDRLHPTFNDLDRELASRGEGAEGKDGEGFRLNIVNALWGQQGCAFLPDFLDLLAEDYGAGLRLLDFVQAAEEARLTINNWVSEQTEGRIEDLIAPGVINALTRLVLTNAIYFNAAWAEPFEPRMTEDRPFYLLDGSQVTVPMMQKTESFSYAEGRGYQAVELPYDGGELSMVILLPAAGEFATFEGLLDADQVDVILEGLERRQIALVLPKFEFESDFGLKETLGALGMPVAFSDDADFSGMTGNLDLFIAEVIHKAFVSVDEAGTEAAAATAVVMQLKAMPAKPLEVIVDRPFIFLIHDIETGTIIFVGRVVDPAA